MKLARLVAVLAMLVVFVRPASARAAPPASDDTRTPESSPPPPEEQRFDNAEFRSELLRRGLEDLLAYYKRTRPPAPRGIDAELTRREAWLQHYQDSSLPVDERVAALDRAIALLEALARRHPAPPRAWQWKLQLGKDLLFRRAEPYYNNILYRGWTSADSRSLDRFATRAEQTFLALSDEIGAFLARVDGMTPAEFRRVERSRALRAADLLKPQADYFLQWSRFYRVLACREHDQQSKTLLQDIMRFMERESDYTAAPHSQTGVQAQSLLLVGMCRRLLGDWQHAGERLVQARNLVVGLPEDQAGPLRWVYILAQLELAKLARDAGHFALARQVTGALEEWRLRQMPDNFALALAVALLEGDVCLREADRARDQGRDGEAADLRIAARAPLLALLRADPDHQGDVFQACAALVDARSDPATMDPFEQNAVMAALLGEVADLQAGPEAAAADPPPGTRITETLERVLEVGHFALQDASDLGRELRPFALFNVAVAHYQLGRPDQAVEHFVTLVEEHPDFPRRETALDYAVRIAADHYARDPARSDRRRLEIFVRGLGALQAAQPDSEQALYWRYFLADALGRLGRLEDSAEMFARVPASSENYHSATYLEAVKRWEIYRALSDANADARALEQRLSEVIQAARRCQQACASAIDGGGPPARTSALRGYQAGALLLEAQACLQPTVDRPQRALEILEGFQDRFAEHPDLIGQAWRLRLAAHQNLGQLDRAGRIVDRYLEREPESAGPVMGQLLRSMMDEVRRLREAGRPCDRAAADALQLARKLCAWAREHPDLLGEASPDSFQVRLAGAHLLAGNYQRTLEIVARYLPDHAGRRPDGPAPNVEALQYQAEALYQLGRYAEAQPAFYELWTLRPEGSKAWWQALLRSLQCHTEMHSAPARIVAEIRRLRHTRPDMGGPALKAGFERLEQINTQRSATSAGGGQP